MKVVLAIAGTLFLLLAPLAMAQHAEAPLVLVQAKKKAACVRCTARCTQCGRGSGCTTSCQSNGNPMVRTDEPCNVDRFSGCR